MIANAEVIFAHLRPLFEWECESAREFNSGNGKYVGKLIYGIH